MFAVKHTLRDLVIGVVVAGLVAGAGWAFSPFVPPVLNYGCPAAVDAPLARGYRFLERMDFASARRDAEDIVLVAPKCAKAHALWAEAAAAMMAQNFANDDNRRTARREAATAENLGLRTDALDAILNITQIADGAP